MTEQTFQLWENVPGMCEEVPQITAYVPKYKQTKGAVVILPGGGYSHRSPNEGEKYARFLADHGVTAFVCDYRVEPHYFPLPLLDARRAMQFVRYHAEEYGLDRNKIYIMGSSAGGHLAALTSTYLKTIPIENPDAIDEEDFLPDGQILCYPVIQLTGNGIAHFGSGRSLLGADLAEYGEELSPNLIAGEGTPKAFIWHTFADNCVNVKNSLLYAERLKEVHTETELHIFPRGNHGMGLAEELPHVAQWSKLLLKWLDYNGFFAG